MFNFLMLKLIEKLFTNKSFLLEDNKHKKHPFLLGFRKGFAVYDLEKAVTTYLKVLNIVRYLKKQKVRFLFIGSPVRLELKIKKSLLESSHYYVSSSEWIPGSLRNKTYSPLPSVIVVFNPKPSFSNLEIVKCGIPLVSFMEADGLFTNVDFPIVLNTKSKGVEDMFSFLVKACLEKT